MADLTHLRTFVTVHRTGSLSEAANLLGISQPTVSAHIQALEASFGFALFVRGRTGVVPTAKAGELARDVAGHIDALDDIAALSAVEPDGRRALHLGGPAELLSTTVVPALPEVRAVVDAPVRLVFGLADDLLESLRTGALDVVVSAVRPRVVGISATPLYDEEFVLVAAPQWAASVDDGWSATPLVAYAENLPIVRRYWRSVFGRRPDELDVTAVIPDLRGIRVAVLAGLGMSVLPSYLVSADLTSGALVALHTPSEAPLNTGYLATRSGDLARRPRLRVLADELVRLVG